MPARTGRRNEGKTMTRVLLGFLAYLVPTFALGFVWHMVLFADAYDALATYRDDVIIPFGLLAMTIQGAFFALFYTRVFAERVGSFASKTIGYAALGGGLSWSFTTIAVAAKTVMTSVPDYLLMETGYTVVQWIIVAPLTVLAFGARRKPARR
jgi:hypothetical protein